MVLGTGAVRRMVLSLAVAAPLAGPTSIRLLRARSGFTR